MIALDLQCSMGHSFEGWFDNREAFESQKKQGFIECPVCSDKNVTIVPSIFSIPGAIKKKPVEMGSNLAVGAELGKKISEFVEKNFDDVGTDFAKEALKMHYGVSKPRNIRGVSSPEEEKLLDREGIPLVKVPMLVKNKNNDA
jgi:hypothetical protein